MDNNNMAQHTVLLAIVVQYTTTIRIDSSSSLAELYALRRSASNAEVVIFESQVNRKLGFKIFDLFLPMPFFDDYLAVILDYIYEASAKSFKLLIGFCSRGDNRHISESIHN